MKDIDEAKNLTHEIAELLKDASREQKLQIKGMLIGAKALSGLNEVQKEVV